MLDIHPPSGWGPDHSLPTPPANPLKETSHLSETHWPSVFWVTNFEMVHPLYCCQPPEVRGQDGPCSPSLVSNFTMVSFLSDFSKLFSDIFKLSTYFTSRVTRHMLTHEITHVLTSPEYVSTDSNLHPLGLKKSLPFSLYLNVSPL